MTDMEKLALQRDRGYLLRLALVLVVGVVVGIALFLGLTGPSVSAWLAESFL